MSNKRRPDSYLTKQTERANNAASESLKEILEKEPSEEFVNLINENQVLIEAEDFEVNPESIVFTEVPVMNSNAYSVVRTGDLYLGIKIPFNKSTLTMGTPDIIYESTDRWDIQSRILYEMESEIFDREALDE